MKKLSLSLALSLALASSLWANLDETDSQIMARYGKMLGAPTSISNRDITKYFLYKDFIATVTLIDGVSQREAFSRKDEKELTQVDMALLLDANTLRSKWVMMSDTKDNKGWLLDSKEAMASYNKHQHILTLQTQTMVAFDNALKNLGSKQGN